MALVQCRECGSNVSDSAISCPQCGVDGPAGTGTLIVERRKKFMGGAVGVSVQLNGVGHGVLRSGQSVALDLAPGSYALSLWARGQGSEAEVVIRSGKTTKCDVDLNAMNAVKATVGSPA